jgi:tRNA threonylcarbamoyl adenosine modification protein YeaZ
MILGIDTSAAQCAVALVGAGAPVAERIAMDRDHADHLFPMIDSVLGRAGASYRDLTRVAVCTGPGSFTGVRIGVAAARGIALGRAIPAIGINRFEALAAEAGGPVTVCLSGRGGTVYLQAFDAAGTAINAPKMLHDAALALAAVPGTTRFAGDAAPLFASSGALLPDGVVDPSIVAKLAENRPAGVLPAPLYLRGADANPPREGPPVLLD